jgi:hypothetical protein
MTEVRGQISEIGIRNSEKIMDGIAPLYLLITEFATQITISEMRGQVTAIDLER